MPDTKDRALKLRAERIREARVAAKLKQGDVADALNVSQSSVQQWESGKTEVRTERMGDLAKVLKRSVNWLMTGEDDPRPNTDSRIEPYRPGAKDFPVYGAAEGGPSGALVLSSDPIDWVPRPPPLLLARDAFAVYVVGSSMEPAYNQGDMAFVWPRKPARPGVDVILQATEEDGTPVALLKRLVGWNAKEWTVSQFNPPETFKLPKSKWPTVSVVVGKYNAG